MKNDNWIKELHTIPKYKLHSQAHEEGYMRHIMAHIGESNKLIVDIGAWDGVYLSNSKYFIDVLGFKGILIDGDNRGNKDVHEEWITAENVAAILMKYNCPVEFDILSYDTDGNDIWILEEILKNHSPRLIVSEFNPIWKSNENRTIKYNAEHVWGDDSYYGYSFAAGQALAEKFGYKIIFQNDDLNLYYVRKDLLHNPNEPIHVHYNEGRVYHKPHSPEKVWVEYK